jgi:predicted nucleic acid-binding protein
MELLHRSKAKLKTDQVILEQALNCLDLLKGHARVLVPEIIWQEVQRHRMSALRHRYVTLTRVSDIPAPDRSLARFSRVHTIHRGEQQALRLMRRYPNALLLTDDEAARKLAKLMHYAVRSTIGVLLTAWQDGRKTKRQVLHLLRVLPRKSTLFVSQMLLGTVIAHVREAPHG